MSNLYKTNYHFKDINDFVEKIFDNTVSFDDKAMFAFEHQYQNNPIYRKWCDIPGINVQNICNVEQIPFMPVSFFKTHTIVTGSFEPEIIFESSGTTQTVNSKHCVKDHSLYENSFIQTFEKFYGSPNGWCIIGLLPAYLERQHSSLVAMVDSLVKRSGHPQSGFYLYEFDRLHQVLQELETSAQKTLVIGVTFALLDFAAFFPMDLKHTTIMETGGMKGRRKEMTRQEVHEFLTTQLGVDKIHSEYGMTELLSQAYSKGDGLFSCPHWMKVLVRDDEDPLSVKENGKGILNIVDLANIHSCSFIAIEDMGTVYENGNFEVSGRVDNSDIRGCSLLAI